MAAPAIPCDSCGSPIPDSDLETGNAITLLGKRYCAGCKTEAIQSVSLDDLAARPSGAPPAPRPAAPKPAPAPPAKAAAKVAARAPSPTPARPPSPPAARPAAPQKSAPPDPDPAPARPERKAAPRRAAPAAAPAPSRKPLLLIGVAAVVVIGVVAAVFLLRGNSSPPTDSSGGKGGSTGSSSGAKGPDRDAQAREAYARVEELSRRAGTSWDLLLAAADKAKPACRGTEWEKRLEDLRARAAHEKETEDAARDLSPLVDELKGAVATDPEFKRFVELQPKFQLALEMAGKTSSARMPEIRALQKDYNGKYEKLAEPYYNEINEEATQLAEERRYDDALRKINSFPQHLRHSVSWLSLDRLRQDIEKRKKLAPPKK